MLISGGEGCESPCWLRLVGQLDKHADGAMKEGRAQLGERSSSLSSIVLPALGGGKQLLLKWREMVLGKLQGGGLVWMSKGVGTGMTFSSENKR